jgi:hypothetical protein
MQSTQLVLGIGNEGKGLLKSLENQFPSWQFSVLDCWSKVQDVKAIDEISGEESIRLRRVHDLSYYIVSPQVALRFDSTKYDDDQTQKIARYLPNYLELLQEERSARFIQCMSSKQSGLDVREGFVCLS